MFELKNLRICTFNANSLTNEANRREFFTWAINSPYDIYAIQETMGSRTSTYNQHKFTREWRTEWNHRTGRQEESVFVTKHCAIFIKNKNIHHTPNSTISRCQDRLLAIKVYTTNPTESLEIINLYVPANSGTTAAPYGKREMAAEL